MLFYFGGKMKNCTNLNEVRVEIDLLDEQIIALLAQREGYVLQAAKFKRDEDAVKAPDRVEQVIQKVRHKAQMHGANPEIVEVVYRNMIQAFITQELSEHKRIADAIQCESPKN